MQKGFVRTLKLFVVIAIVGCFVWFLVLSPMITFRHNEEVLENAARRYFELNSEELPTGERVKTLSLNVLYDKSYLKETFYAPLSHDACSVDKSWVKVRRENGHYQYYVYLDCGVLTSNVDHKGPTISLKGNEEISISIGDEFEDPGVDGVVDDSDGKLDISKVTVKGDVDTSKVGTYEIEYSAYDHLNNKSTVVRVVNVVKILKSFIKQDLGDLSNYMGNPSNNYVRLSNMYFRIMGLDANENVILVAEEDVANVSYDSLESWLDDYYMEHFTNDAKKLLVKTKFCNMKISTDSVDTTQCTSYTDKRYAYVPSVIDVNKADEDGLNFLKPLTISWTANKATDEDAYVTRNVFYEDEYGKNFITVDSSFNYGVRPKIVMKGSTYITGGDGSHDNPYVFGESRKAKGGTLLNDRYTGEYVSINGFEWRIIETLDDGTTKVISDDTLGSVIDRPMTYSNPESSVMTFNPKDKENYAYYINNQASKYVDTSLFVTHEVVAPVYKKKIIYRKESKNNTFKLKISPPNMFEMFSAQSTTRGGKKSHSYWLINSSTSKDRYAGVVTDIGVVLNEPIQKYGTYGIRAVGFIKKGTVISNGLGTYASPYKLK